MKERGILFSAPMVRALLDGSKTQTRRAVKPQPERCELGGFITTDRKGRRWAHGLGFNEAATRKNFIYQCPYGVPGDRLWVRETAAEISCRLTYRADTDDGAHCVVKRWTPSIHMPREWSRILLEITSVRVERLQEIGDRDAIAEGIDRVEDNYGNGPAYCDYRMKDQCDTAEWFNSPVDSYQSLWESINGAGSWDANPWVWVVEFKRVT